MNLGLNLKFRKPSQDLTHKRTRTDYQTTRRNLDDTQRCPEYSYKQDKPMHIGMQVKQKSMKLTHNRLSTKSTFGCSTIVTEMQDKLTDRPAIKDIKRLQASFQKLGKTKYHNYEVSKPEKPIKKAEDRYQVIEKAGSGTFGTVNKARDRQSLEIVAIKKVYQDKKYKNRQLEILKMLQHPHILEMRDHFITQEQQKQYLNIVMDFFPCNLYEYILRGRARKIQKLKFKVIAFQLFLGLLYLQQLSIAHRDIKPQNILICESTLRTVICDFGSAKMLVPNQPNISYICSRCYRAPELVFENTKYSTQIDVWSAGCVLVEMVIGVPLFRAASSLEHLVEIIKVLGTPTLQQIKQMNKQYDTGRVNLPRVPKQSWAKILKTDMLGPEFISLIDGILVYSPSDRLTPVQILQHEFFDEIKVEPIYQYLRQQLNIPSLFNFQDQFKSNKFDQAVPDWYRWKHYSK